MRISKEWALRRPYLNLTCLTCAISVTLALLATGCSRPQRAPAATLSSPSDLASVRFCADREGDAIVISPLEDCTRNDDTVDLARAVSRVAVASRGSQMIHVLDSDLRSPRFVNFDRGIPGNTGVIVADGPNQVAQFGERGYVAYTSERVAAFGVVDTVFGRPVPLAFRDDPDDIRPHLRLNEPSNVLAVIPDSSYVVVSQPLRQVLHVYDVEISCDGAPERNASNCEPMALIAFVGEIALDAMPRSVALTRDGRAYIARSGLGNLAIAAVAPPALDEHCAGVPCIFDRVSVTHSCRDGLDNDADGLIDHADRQCFGDFDDESGFVLNGTRTECSDGIDNDADGLIDSEDADCFTAAQAVEGPARVRPPCEDGLDNDLDGAIDDADPGCAATGGASEFARANASNPPTVRRRPPACSDGIDNDADGLIDWPADPGCFGPNDMLENVTSAISLGDMALTAEEDLLFVTERTLRQVVLLDTDSNTLVEERTVSSLRDIIPGFLLPRREPLALTTSTIRSSRRLRGDTFVETRERVAHIATGDGIAYTIDIDREISLVDRANDERTVRSSERVERFSLRDAVARRGSVRRLTCDIPSAIFDDVVDVNLACSDPRFPRPAVLDPDLLDADDTTPYFLQNPNAFVLLPERQDPVLNEEESAVIVEQGPDDVMIPGDVYHLTYEGVVPGTRRSDAVLVGDGQWLAVLGASPCAATDDVCSLGLDLSECPTAQLLCDTGADLCSDDFDICRLCPGACGAAASLCNRGVVPGDRLVIQRPESRRNLPATCDAFVVPTNPADRLAAPRLEYEITHVEAGRVRFDIVPRDLDPDGETTTVLPDPACFARPFDISIRAGNAWLLNGRDRFGHDSPFDAVDGQCVPRHDFAEHVGRPRFGEVFMTRHDMAFMLEPGTEPPVRDFRLQLSVDAGYGTRTTDTRQFLLGPGTSAVVSVDTPFGSRVVFADASQDFVWVYSGVSFRQVDRPIP